MYTESVMENCDLHIEKPILHGQQMGRAECPYCGGVCITGIEIISILVPLLPNELSII